MKAHSQLKTVCLYARVSTKDGRQDTENQLIALREYCAKRGWEIAAEYVDHETGGTAKRPHFQQMFADARTRKFDLVFFWSLDRLSREGVTETLNHLQRLTSYGVGWRSFTEEYLDSTGLFKDAVIAILAVIAKQERVRRSERAKAAIEASHVRPDIICATRHRLRPGRGAKADAQIRRRQSADGRRHRCRFR